MCGIAGIIGRIAPPQQAALARMCDAMVHRGPDAHGEWASDPDERGWGVMLGHRRLAILDLSAAGAQPMVDPVTGHVVVLNGEIYNYRALRADLASKGHTVSSSGDTAVMLRALSVGGHAALPTLRGMFAFALWDPAKRELLLARDPLGIKPLYVIHNPDLSGDWSLAFASEVRALLASGLLGRPRLNARATASMVWNGYMVAPETAVEGIASMAAGEARTFGVHGEPPAAWSFWSMRKENDGPAVDEQQLEQSLRECVGLHLASDVPLGVFLSGGVDSSAVAHLARQASDEPVHTFTLAFEEAGLNEGPFARRIAQAIGTEHKEVVLTSSHFVNHLDAALDSLDQPSFDGINSYFMSHAVAQAGFKVALVGSGGDELFGGYTSFRDLPPLARWSRRARWVPMSWRLRLATMATTLLQPKGGAFAPQTRWAKLPDLVGRGDDLLALYQLAYALFLPRAQQDLLGRRASDALIDGLPADMHDRLRAQTQGLGPLRAVSVMEQRLFLGERLLRDTDAVSMSASIEVRLPLVDQVLLDQVNQVPDAMRYHPVRAKALLRKVGLRGLDPALFDRPKAGFELPYDRWLRSSLGTAIDDTLRDADAVRSCGLEPEPVARLWRAFVDGAPGLYWSRVWALYVFVRWCQRHDVRL